MREFLLGFISQYGWYLTFCGLSLYFVYSRFMKPHLDKIKELDELERRKKFDEDVAAKYTERMLAARAKQQEEHNIVAAEMEEKRKAQEEEKLRKLREELAKESVLKNALGTHETHKSKKAAPPAKETPSEFIWRLAKSKPVVIFSKSWCPFCRKAKQTFAPFRLKDAHLEYVELEEREDCEAVQAEFERQFGSRTVPKVFVNGSLLGGCDDIVQLNNEGLLEVLVTDAVTQFDREQK